MSRKTIYIIAGSVVVLLIIFFASMNLTSSTKFCGTVCHVMIPYYESHAESKHKYIDCSHCHIPEDNYAYKVYYKAKSGASHIYHNIRGDYPLNFRLSEDSKPILQKNCSTCHAGVLSRIAILNTEEKPCYSCHAGVGHPNLLKENAEQAQQKK